jgi:diguanylate cyclase (GGDEF)-like protein
MKELASRNRGLQQAHIKALEAEVSRLRQLITRDPLTGCYTRNGFHERLDPLVADILFTRAHPNKRRVTVAHTLSILFIDVDDFKKINDTQGHAEGDRVLARVASFILSTVRRRDVVSRWGGEEFVVGLVNTDEKGAYPVAEKLRRKILRSSEAPKITVSVGVADFIKETSTLDEVVDRADRAMYVAKHERGKNNTVRFSEVGDQ